MTAQDSRSGCDPELGCKVGKALESLGLETPRSSAMGPGMGSRDILEGHVREILEHLGLDLSDDSLRDTPRRVAKMWLEETFKGLDYRNFPKCTVIENKMEVNEIIAVRDIAVFSTCEHHLVPFTGVAHVGYIPAKKIIGLSKFNRIVDFFSRRPQVQERLTEQIHTTLREVLETDDVAVIIDCTHHCVRLRGVKDVNSSTVTSKMGGRFMSKPEARTEFMQLIRG